MPAKTKLNKDIWEYIVPERLKRYGPDIADIEKRATWCQAIFYGGNTLRLWNEAVPLKMTLLTACSVQRGQKIALIAKYAEESGLASALRSLLGPRGEIAITEVGAKAVAAFKGARKLAANKGQWNFNYLDAVPDASLDRVVFFNSPAHAANWPQLAGEVNRVLKNGGRVIIADAPWGGKELLNAARMVIHFRGQLTALLSGMGFTEEELPDVGLEDMDEYFSPYLTWKRGYSWRGLYLFYGQKNGEETQSLKLPASVKNVKSFLTQKPLHSPWDLLANAEIEGLGKEVQDIESQKKWGRVITFGSSMEWMHKREPGIWDIMYANLQAKPGFKVMVIGEFLEHMFLPELKKRIGENGEIAAFDTGPLHRVVFEKLWKEGADTFIPERHQWDYPWADKYPDEYFDLIWIPHGVHHAKSWEDIGPRLLRVLKPGGQIMMAEGRFNHPLFHTALSTSGLMNCIAEKVYWASHVTFREMPDYTTDQLQEAFGDAITGVFKLECLGWLVFWGYKK